MNWVFKIKIVVMLHVLEGVRFNDGDGKERVLKWTVGKYSLAVRIRTGMLLLFKKRKRM